MPDIEHNSITGASLHAPFHYIQSGTPGAPDEGQFWLDTTSEPYILKQYVSAAWVEVGASAEVIEDAVGVAVAGAGYASANYDDGTGVTTVTVAKHETALIWTLDEGGVPQETFKSWLLVPFAGTLKRWYLLADPAGSVVLDVWRSTLGGFPPDVTDTIIDTGTKPALSAAVSNNATISDWASVAVTANDILTINVDSADTVTLVTFVLVIERT